jgi:hypothetical protein
LQVRILHIRTTASKATNGKDGSLRFESAPRQGYCRLATATSAAHFTEARFNDVTCTAVRTPVGVSNVVPEPWLGQVSGQWRFFAGDPERGRTTAPDAVHRLPANVLWWQLHQFLSVATACDRHISSTRNQGE